MSTSPAHSRDLRRGRYSEPGRVYHVRASTDEHQPVFQDIALGRILVQNLKLMHDRGEVESLAFVVMPDHLHWLIHLGAHAELARVMHDVKGRTSRQVNLRRGLVDQPLWQAGYFDRALRAEEDLKDVARYIVSNPIRAGLCERVGDYPLWDAIWL